jgi:hypothetical protein
VPRGIYAYSICRLNIKVTKLKLMQRGFWW